MNPIQQADQSGRGISLANSIQEGVEYKFNKAIHKLICGMMEIPKEISSEPSLHIQPRVAKIATRELTSFFKKGVGIEAFMTIAENIFNDDGQDTLLKRAGVLCFFCELINLNQEQLFDKIIDLMYKADKMCWLAIFSKEEYAPAFTKLMEKFPNDYRLQEINEILRAKMESKTSLLGRLFNTSFKNLESLFTNPAPPPLPSNIQQMSQSEALYLLSSDIRKDVLNKFYDLIKKLLQQIESGGLTRRSFLLEDTNELTALFKEGIGIEEFMELAELIFESKKQVSFYERKFALLFFCELIYLNKEDFFEQIIDLTYSARPLFWQLFVTTQYAPAFAKLKEACPNNPKLREIDASLQNQLPTSPLSAALGFLGRLG